MRHSFLTIGCGAISLAASGVAPAPSFRLLTVPLRDTGMLPYQSTSAVSADGRYLAFVSYARLVPADTNDQRDVYVLDRVTGLVTIESLTPEGRASTTDAGYPRLSGNGRYVAFEQDAVDDTGESFGRLEIVLRDRWADMTAVVTRGAAGEPANGSSRHPVISADGGVVAFESYATNLVAGADANGAAADVYVLEVATGAVARVSVDTAGRQQRLGASLTPSITADGRFVAFVSTADLDGAPGAPLFQGTPDSRPLPFPNVYLRDIVLNATKRVSASTRGAMPNGPSSYPALSGDGRYIAFVSERRTLSIVIGTSWRMCSCTTPGPGTRNSSAGASTKVTAPTGRVALPRSQGTAASWHFNRRRRTWSVQGGAHRHTWTRTSSGMFSYWTVGTG